MTTQSLEKTFHFNLYIYQSMTKAEKRIAYVFAWYYKLWFKRVHKESFPSQEMICKKAKCSRSTMTRFLKEYSGFLFTKIEQPQWTSKNAVVEFQSNRYEYCHSFFNLLCFLKAKGWLKRWSYIGLSITHEASENEELVMKRMGYDFICYEHEMTHGYSRKRRTKDLKSSSKILEYNVPTKSVPHSPISEIPGLKEGFIEIASKTFSPYVLKEVKKDYDFYVYHGNVVYSPGKFIESRAMAQTKNQIKMLMRKKEDHKIMRRN